MLRATLCLACSTSWRISFKRELYFDFAIGIYLLQALALAACKGVFFLCGLFHAIIGFTTSTKESKCNLSLLSTASITIFTMSVHSCKSGKFNALDNELP